ncbi:unnamed protein product [Bursaphelenchus okinawaensis]|uniref:Uncharacterized protein n=1 Tax=Bursaphelenchus okinawaensis TaxID=465554 RepID=A0A811KVC0_9BILA|nr:unnamed protein product [Bursaphelenchus okinawaensis]CAG9112190.1 unnamed protein product [Bursaphelenchus okinawaensis]
MLIQRTGCTLANRHATFVHQELIVRPEILVTNPKGGYKSVWVMNGSDQELYVQVKECEDANVYPSKCVVPRKTAQLFVVEFLCHGPQEQQSDTQKVYTCAKHGPDIPCGANHQRDRF